MIEFYHGDTSTRDRPTHEVLTFPGGELHVKLGPVQGREYAIVRGADPADLITLALWADAVRRAGATPSAAIPYLPGARQDRYEPTTALSAAVYADLINSCSLSRVVAIDVHSPVMEALVDNLVVLDGTGPISRMKSTGAYTPWVGVIAPDAGAGKRTFAVAQALGLPMFQALKHRDPKSGRLTGFSCEELPKGRYLVVDDICDGGGTFRGLAKEILHTHTDESKNVLLDLYVTHGIFSGEAKDLAFWFEAVISTDSHPGHLAQKFTTISITTQLLAALEA